jgi:hypothetical protein
MARWQPLWAWTQLACATNMEHRMKKSILITLAAAVCALAAGTAEARTNVFWSIGINAAPIGLAVSNAPYYAPAPVYVPAPLYVEPAPFYVEPAPIVYAAPRVVYRRPVVVAPRYYGPSPVVYGGYGYGRHWDGRAGEWRQHGRDGRHDEYGDHRNGWQPVPRDQRRYPH